MVYPHIASTDDIKSLENWWVEASKQRNIAYPGTGRRIMKRERGSSNVPNHFHAIGRLHAKWGLQEECSYM